MFGIIDIGLFVISGILLNLIPGPDSLYVLGRSGTQGFKAGSIAAIGIGSGTLIHIMAAAFGLSALLATSAIAFTIVKYIGAAYLLYMAVTLLLTKNKTKQTQIIDPISATYRSIFLQGFLTNVLNPKVAMFFLAFVPQFIAPNAENKVVAFLILGLIFNLNAMIWCHILALFGSYTGKKIKQSNHIRLWLSRATGVLFGYFGIRLAILE